MAKMGAVGPMQPLGVSREPCYCPPLQDRTTPSAPVQCSIQDPASWLKVELGMVGPAGCLSTADEGELLTQSI